MEGTLNEFSITTTRKRPASTLQDSEATESIQKRCRSTTKVTCGFTSDMIFEILTLLPAKSLMRFRCVSKAWNKLIRHDLNFVKMHYARSHARPSAARLLFELAIVSPYHDVVESTYNSPTQLEGFPLQLVCPRHNLDSREIFIFSNHCNGLVCLYSYEDSQVYLYNVTTGEFNALPYSESETITKGSSIPMLFLGFDLNTDKYKLLHIKYSRKKQHNKAKILTLGTDSWRRIDEKCLHNLYSHSSECVFVNGVLYWNQFLLNNTINYFNFIEEKFGTLSIPQQSGYLNILNKMQTALWGKLVIVCSHERFGIDDAWNWVYDEVNKGFKKFKIDLEEEEEEKVALIEAKNIEETLESCPEVILATSSLIRDSTFLVLPHRFCLRCVSSFVENIIPLTFIYP